jgi:hypothetical protein
MGKRKPGLHSLWDENCPKCRSEKPGEKSCKAKHICARAQGSVAPVASPPPGSEDGSQDGSQDGHTPEEVEAQRLLRTLDLEMDELMALKESKLARVLELKDQIGEMSEEMSKIFQRLRDKDAVDREFGPILSSMITMLLNQSQTRRRK